MRQSKIANYMEMAEVVAKRSHDSETKVGAVLVNNNTGALLATGFNGFVRKAPDDILPNTRPDKYEYVVHAEANLICNCAHHGIPMANCTLVCTLSPCKACMRMIYNCGITKVIARDIYKDFDQIREMKDIQVSLELLDGLYHINYKT